MKGYVFIKTNGTRKKILKKLHEFGKIKEMSTAFSSWDIIAEIEADDKKDIGGFVSRISKRYAVGDSLTLIGGN